MCQGTLCTARQLSLSGGKCSVPLVQGHPPATAFVWRAQLRPDKLVTPASTVGITTLSKPGSHKPTGPTFSWVRECPRPRAPSP